MYEGPKNNMTREPRSGFFIHISTLILLFVFFVANYPVINNPTIVTISGL